MKVAVYAVALNEGKHVQRFMDSCKGADLVLVGDTGSTDGTPRYLRTLGAKVIPLSVKPWRFDMARNAVLAALPASIDWCIILDLDEVLSEGWRDQLAGVPDDARRVLHPYIWSHNPDGTDDIRFYVDRIHRRDGFIWRYPGHETLCWYADATERESWRCEGLAIHHWPDPHKSRGSYLGLLEIGYRENPERAFYYARELYFHQRWAEAIPILEKAFEGSGWAPERRYVALAVAACQEGLGDQGKRLAAIQRGIHEEPESPAGFCELARYQHDRADWADCLIAAEQAVGLLRPNGTHFDDEKREAMLAYDLGALAAYHLGDFDLARLYGRAAVAAVPDEQRLKANLEFYEHARQAVPA